MMCSGLVSLVCFGLAILASLWGNTSTTILVPQATRQHTREQCQIAASFFLFLFFLGAGGGRGVCGECLSLKSLVERMQTIESEQSVIVLFHACLHHVFGMHEVCTLSVWREIPFIVDMEHVF